MTSTLELKAKETEDLDADEMGIYHYLNIKNKEFKNPFRIVKGKTAALKKKIRNFISDDKKAEQYHELPVCYVETGVLNLVPGVDEGDKVYFSILDSKKLYVMDKANQPKTRFRYWDGHMEDGYTFHENSPYPIDLQINRLDESERLAKTEYEESKSLVGMKFAASLMNLDENQVKFLRLVALISGVGGFGFGIIAFSMI